MKESKISIVVAVREKVTFPRDLIWSDHTQVRNGELSDGDDLINEGFGIIMMLITMILTFRVQVIAV